MAPVTAKTGEVLRRHREQQVLTQEAVATKAGITPVALHKVETGKSSPKSDTLERVAAALGMRYRSLVDEADDEVMQDELRRKIKEELRAEVRQKSRETPPPAGKKKKAGKD